jgi:hypothetical protein
VTGNFSGSSASQWFFDGGGAITLVGGIPALGIPDGTLLFSGAWDSASVTNLSTTFKITGGAFSDTKLEELTAHYGLPGGLTPYSGFINLSFFSNAANPPSAFASTNLGSGDLTNTPRVPEPATGALLLLGIAPAIALAGRYRKTQYALS